jgi:hypothetical protein
VVEEAVVDEGPRLSKTYSRMAGAEAESNDSTSPAMDQSRPEPSSPVQVQSKKYLDWDRTDPRC